MHPKEPQVESLREVITMLADTREGAFSPVSSNPVLAALALPPGGFGLITLLQLWFRAG